MTEPQPQLDRILAQFDLERLDRDLFLGSPGPGKGRLFGGLIAAQAVIAAGRTVDEGRYLHSLHAYFLRPGNHDAPIRYAVYRIRDGRSFTSRDVFAYQSGEAIFSISTSYATLESGGEFQAAMPETPRPETLRDLEAEWTLAHGDDDDRAWLTTMPVEQRHHKLGGVDPATDLPWRGVWIRPKGTIPDDGGLHAALLAWISDDGLMSTVSWDDDPAQRRGMRASLDHAMWFHEPPRWDGWLLYRSESVVGRNGRALITGAMYTPEGRRVLSVTQEALIRPPKGQAGLSV
jgi:acyl-CoA thioesterase-2